MRRFIWGVLEKVFNLFGRIRRTRGGRAGAEYERPPADIYPMF